MQTSKQNWAECRLPSPLDRPSLKAHRRPNILAERKAQHEYWRRPSFFLLPQSNPASAGCCFNSNSDPRTKEKGKRRERVREREKRGKKQPRRSPLSHRLRTQIRMTGSMDLPAKGGFSYDLCRRNDFLEKKGLKVPGFLKTGTTIVGLVFQDGVVLGADTRATEGPIVADKNCEKIHFMAPNIYCCGAGTAADTEAVTDMVSSQLQLHRYATGRESRVVTALTLLKSHLFKYQGHVSAALVLGGVDVTGPHLHTVYPHGSTDTLPFATMGSGSLAAMSVFESQYKEGLTREEGIQLVSDAIRAGIFNDLGSGSNVDVCVITKGKTEYLRNHELPNPRTYVSSKGYSFTKGQTEVLSTKITKITQLKQKVEVAEGGDAMEE
ncbi:Proteasome subunit beta type-7-B [Dichanthelium oligosanthes]|uniref:proteasome endopeptidase complex n=1 Tax=Dichanthelium oligosanthes TaxID=888268 RepID=A0A1E5W3E7_9POAL|nr:Proteasome subunit beta type-7-B [Dichanthelium oligosanthes]